MKLTRRALVVAAASSGALAQPAAVDFSDVYGVGAR